MVGTRRNAPRSGVADRANASLRSAPASRAKRASKAGDAVPDIYREMLVEAGASSSRGAPASSEPPLKRPKRPGHKSEGKRPAAPEKAESEDEEDDVEFEDVEIPAPVIQTRELDSEDEDDDEILFEDVDLVDAVADDAEEDKPKGVLELNLGAQQAPKTPQKADRRKALSKAERHQRVEVHQMHVLCLMAHAARRNHWCNDEVVQDTLRPLLTDEMIGRLHPRASLNQFGRTESLKAGLQQVSARFRERFDITERGVRRALWAEKSEHLQNYQLPSDLESTLDKADFREAATKLEGSRDVGAQLFCALLRSAGLEARLVCSLQPLTFAPGAPTLAKPKEQKTPSRPSPATPSTSRTPPQQSTTPAAIPRSRLGHPNAAGYHIPSISRPSPSTSHHRPPAKVIRNESPFPAYWVEILDEAHQKWQPVDPLVTSSQWRPGKLEPPASDKQNNLSYALAFEDDGTAKDVTRRYAKAYNSKTRRHRIDGLLSLPTPASSSPESPSAAAGAHMSGETWLRRALRAYRRTLLTDVDQIENAELAAAEAREPLPRSVADFRDHPVFALQRHLRRHEVLLPSATSSGTVSTGPRAPLERIYRRRDVRVARSAERWYRLGRQVVAGALPVKWLPKPRVRAGGLFGSRAAADEDDDGDDAFAAGAAGAEQGTPVFTFEQTAAYVAPPVVGGRVPKNRFGNLDVYVPSMVPAGGAHVEDERAARAAHLLGVDYAPALTGFSFRGRQGTAVLRGAVVPAEAEEAVRCVVDALGDLEAEAEADRRTLAALRLWSRMLKGLRIRERIRSAAEDRGEIDDEEDDGEDEEEDEAPADGDEDMDEAPAEARSETTEEYDMLEDDQGGGGFLIE